MLGAAGAAALDRFDPFPAPLYATDARGYLLYFNPACVAIAGRTPRVGIDRWCVASSVLSSDGRAIDLATGPVAAVLRDGVAVRGVEALIERADGGRTAIRAFPTPAIDADGEIAGAVNLFVPLDGALHDSLLSTARRCIHLAGLIGDRQARDSLGAMATECRAQAAVLRLD